MDSTPSPTDVRNDSPLGRSDESLAIRKRRIKAHRKSRAGCLMCKTRKVKVSLKIKGRKPDSNTYHTPHSVARRSPDARIVSRWATTVFTVLHHNNRNNSLLDYNRHNLARTGSAYKIFDTSTPSSRHHILRSHSRRTMRGRMISL